MSGKLNVLFCGECLCFIKGNPQKLKTQLLKSRDISKDWGASCVKVYGGKEQTNKNARNVMAMLDCFL